MAGQLSPSKSFNLKPAHSPMPIRSYRPPPGARIESKEVIDEEAPDSPLSGTSSSSTISTGSLLPHHHSIDIITVPSHPLTPSPPRDIITPSSPPRSPTPSLPLCDINTPSHPPVSPTPSPSSRDITTPPHPSGSLTPSLPPCDINTPPHPLGSPTTTPPPPRDITTPPHPLHPLTSSPLRDITTPPQLPIPSPPHDINTPPHPPRPHTSSPSRDITTPPHPSRPSTSSSPRDITTPPHPRRPFTPPRRDVATPTHSPRPLTPSPRHRPPTNKPSDKYLYENERKNYRAFCLPLYEAALKGDWQAAQGILDKCPDVINVSLTTNYETALHIVSSTKHTQFVENLVNLMKPEDLELQNYYRNTALCLAAAAGTVKIAEIMLKKKHNLLTILGNNGTSPLLFAAVFGHKDMVSYLYSQTNNMTAEDWTDTDRIMLLQACIRTKIYDVALKLLHHHKEKLALATDRNALHVLARYPSEFAGKGQPLLWRLLNNIFPRARIGAGEKKCEALEIVQIIWGEIVDQKDEVIWDIMRGPAEDKEVGESDHPTAKHGKKEIYPSRILFVAAALGNTKFITELIRLRPDLIWKIDGNDQTIFHVAVSHRQESVYNLLYEIGSIKDLVTSFSDTNKNNILHLAAIKPKQDRLHVVSGVALQMQRELLWYKEVETMVHPSLREQKNKQGKTPKDLFTEQHADLVEKGERWMKETASQCMVVAALIATIMFAAAFTLPGGNKDTGLPMFKHRSAFIVFVITDAVSLFSSSASILMFLAILTARYAERDFLASLPLKLMIGLLALLISITTMMIAFSASFFLVYTKGTKWLPYLISALAGVPVVLFAGLQYRLFYDVVRTTYSSRFLFKPKKHMLY